MNTELKQKWITALRSGEWKQGKCHLRLRERQEYCCLGVLCEVSGEGLEYDEGSWEWVPTNPDHRNGDKLAVGSWGLSSLQIEQLCSKNDSGCTFTEIAEWVEASIIED